MIALLCRLITTTKKTLILHKSPTDKLDDTTITAEAEYSINFSEQQQK